MTSSASGLGEAKTDGKPLVLDWVSDEAALPVQAPVPSDSFALRVETSPAAASMETHTFTGSFSRSRNLPSCF